MTKPRTKQALLEGQLLRDRRQELDLTQHQVAMEAGIELQQYQQFEYGTRRFTHCYMATGLRICEILELDPYEFLQLG